MTFKSLKIVIFEGRKKAFIHAPHFMKKFLSYFWPVTRKVHSEINGPMEITYTSGRKVLNSKNANYSYGALQEILEFGLTKVDLKKVDNLLLLGLGGGSIIKSLRETFDFRNQIYAIEIDPEMIQIAKEEFGIVESWNTKIIEDDAFLFTKTTKRRYQLVIIDLFIDTEVPPIFYQKEFCDRLARIISPGGSFIFNVGMNPSENRDSANLLISFFEENFKLNMYPSVHKNNYILIGERLKN